MNVGLVCYAGERGPTPPPAEVIGLCGVNKMVYLKEKLKKDQLIPVPTLCCYYSLKEGMQLGV